MSSVSLDHLSQSARKWLECDNEKRIQYIRTPRWISYPAAQRVLTKLTDLLEYPIIHRMPNVLLVGETNNGKTMLVKQFCGLNPRDENIGGPAICLPVIYVQAPPTPDESRLYNSILEFIGAPYRPNEKVSKKHFQLLKIIPQIGTRMIIIDEIHHILAGSSIKQRNFLNVIKAIGNELQVSIVGVGTRDAFQAIQSDPQLANRFEPIQLPSWENTSEYRQLLASFERSIPLKYSSNLAMEDSLAQKIYFLTDGYLGEIAQLVTRAAVSAIRIGEEKISISLLDDLDWVPPKKRRFFQGR